METKNTQPDQLGSKVNSLTLEIVNGLRGTEGFPDADLAIVTPDRVIVGIVYEAGPNGCKTTSAGVGKLQHDFTEYANLFASAPALKAQRDRLLEVVNAIRERHDAKARAVGRDYCGCRDCEAIQPLIEQETK